MEYLETIFADAIINCSLDTSNGVTTETTSEINDVIEEMRKNSLQKIEDFRSSKRQMTETLVAADQKLSAATSRVLELESILSVARVDAEMKLKEMSRHASSINALIEAISQSKHNITSSDSSSLSSLTQNLQAIVLSMVELQRISVGSISDVSSMDLFSSLNTLNNALITVKRKASMRIRKLTDENTELESNIQKLSVAISEASLKLQVYKKENKNLQVNIQQLQSKCTCSGQLIETATGKGPNSDSQKDSSSDSKAIESATENNKSVPKTLNMQILLLQEECQSLRQKSAELQQSSDQKCETLRAALIQAAKEHEKDRRLHKEELQHLQEQLSQFQKMQVEAQVKWEQEIQVQKSQTQRLQQEKDNWQQQYDKLSHNLQLETNQHSEKHEQLQAQLLNTIQHWQQQHQELQTQFQTLQGAHREMQDTLRHTRESLKLSEESLTNMRLQLRLKEKQGKEAMQKFLTLEKEHEAFKLETLATQKAFHQVTEEAALRKERQQEEKLQAFQNKLQEKEQRIFQMTIDHDQLNENYRLLEEKLYESRFEIDRCQARLQQQLEDVSLRHAQEKVSFTQEIATKTQEIARLSQELQQLSAENTQKQQELTALNHSFQHFQQETHLLIDSLRAEKESLAKEVNVREELLEQERRQHQLELQRQHSVFKDKYAHLQHAWETTQEDLRQCRAVCREQERQISEAVSKCQLEFSSLQHQMAEINQVMAQVSAVDHIDK